MKNFSKTAIALALTVVAGSTVAADVKETGGGLKFKFDNGHKVQIGGRVMLDIDYQFDGIFSGSTNEGDTQSDSELRRGRLYIKGNQGNWSYKWQVDVNQDKAKAQFKDAYIAYNFDPAKLTVGSFKIPFGLEELTSSKYISTIERSDIFNTGAALAGRPSFAVQLSGYNTVGWAVSLFDPENGVKSDSYLSNLGIAGRIFKDLLPGRDVLHVGFAFATYSPGDSYNYSPEGRNGVHTSPVKIRTTLVGPLLVEGQEQTGLEIAYVTGPFSIQAELISVEADQDPQVGDNVIFRSNNVSLPIPANSSFETTANYLQGTWTITGESRGYKEKLGQLGKLKPANDIAWELVAKLENTEYEFANIKGDIDSTTLGLNAYFNNNVRFMGSIVSSEINDVLSELNGLMDSHGNLITDGDAITMRLQYVF